MHSAITWVSNNGDLRLAVGEEGALACGTSMGLEGRDSNSGDYEIEKLLLNTMNALKREIKKDIRGALVQQFRANCVKRASWAVCERAVIFSMKAGLTLLAEQQSLSG